MLINRLDWDSDFFGYEVGKIELTKSSNFNLEYFRKIVKPYKLVAIFSKEQLQEKSITLVDTKIVLSKGLKNEEIQDFSYKNIHSFEYSKSGYESLKKLALLSGVYSRFNIDKNFKNNEYEKLYLKWIDNLVLTQPAFDICVYMEENDILGFTSIEKKEETLADIGLVAVSSSVRGKGVATKLIHSALQSAALHKYDAIQVVTQKENTPAIKLYEKCGFKQSELTYVYHYWNL